MLLELKKAASSQFFIEAGHLRHFATHFLRVWSTEDVFAKINDGTITYEGVKYAVVWKRPPTICRTTTKRLGCSFRKLAGVDTTAYVVIKPWYEGE